MKHGAYTLYLPTCFIWMPLASHPYAAVEFRGEDPDVVAYTMDRFNAKPNWPCRAVGLP
jgi:hypothetical protein